jgi:hypothetical protein
VVDINKEKKQRGALIDEISPLSKVRILHQKRLILMSEV